jgi:hypothetical protein
MTRLGDVFSKSKQQIPFGDDNQKSKSNSKGKSVVAGEG